MRNVGLQTAAGKKKPDGLLNHNSASDFDWHPTSLSAWTNTGGLIKLTCEKVFIQKQNERFKP